MDLYNNNQLDLDPPYQRKSIWSPKDRRFFLDTIFRGYPSPTIFLHKTTGEDGKTKYAVIDGKQRLDTVIMFVKDQISIDKEYGDARLDGKKWSKIRENSELRLQFTDYSVPVEFINVDPSSGYVNDVFDRINRNAKKLTRQELRHAKYDGWMITFLEKESLEPAWEIVQVVTTAKSKRMADIQFLSELLIVVMKGKVSGFDQDELDTFYANFDDPSESTLEEVDFDEERIVQQFSKARDFLVRLEETDVSVSTFAKNLKDFYSLWSVVALNLGKLKTKEKHVSGKYRAFMLEVKRISEMKVVNESKVDPLAYQYQRNNVGASTEPPQREGRHDALQQALLTK